MGRSKALLLATAVAIGASASARAADLLPPPPMVEPPPPPVEFGGWYLRGDVGVGATDLSGWRDTFEPFNVDGTRNQTVVFPNTHSLGDTALFGAGFGYQFNNWLRADFTGEYRTEAAYRAGVLYTFPVGAGFAPVAADAYFGNFGSALFMANGYVDLGTWHGVTPFVGVGVGVASTWLKNLEDGPSLGFAKDTNTTNFAWSVMGGLAMNITPNLKLELAYRYLDMGDFHSNPIQCLVPQGCALERHHFHVASNDLRLGLRYALGGPVAAPVLMAPPPGPLIRKY